MPATSPSDSSSTSTPKPLRSQYLRYMRSSIAAQSCASVPPEPDWMSTKQLFGSSALENMRRNSMLAMSFSAAARSPATLISVASSASARAISNSSPASRNWLSSNSRLPTTPSRVFFSRPSSCARLASLQMSGSSSCRPTSIRRACLVSKSKIPPHFLGAGAEVGEAVGEGIDFFGFHDWLFWQNCAIIPRRSSSPGD